MSRACILLTRKVFKIQFLGQDKKGRPRKMWKYYMKGEEEKKDIKRVGMKDVARSTVCWRVKVNDRLYVTQVFQM